MKYFIALAFIALVAGSFAQLQLTEEQIAKLNQHIKECRKDIKISDEEVSKLSKKDFSSPTDAQKCLGRCILEKIGTIKGDVIQEDVILKKLGSIIGEEKAMALMVKCNGLKGDNDCDTAFKVYECYELAKQ